MNKLISDLLQLFNELPTRYISDLLNLLQKKKKKVIDILINEADISRSYIVYSDETLVSLLKVNDYLNSLPETRAFKTGVSRYLDSISELDIVVTAIQKAANDIDIDLTALMGKERTFALDAIRFHLAESAYKHDILTPLMQSVTRTTLTGGGLKELKEELSKQLKPERLRYTETAARDGLNSYYGVQNAAITEEFDMLYYAYVGTVKEDTRPFCRHVVKDLDGVIERDKLPALLKRFEGSSGMMPDTTPQNFIIKRGGYGCLHQAIPIINKNI